MYNAWYLHFFYNNDLYPRGRVLISQCFSNHVYYIFVKTNVTDKFTHQSKNVNNNLKSTIKLIVECWYLTSRIFVTNFTNKFQGQIHHSLFTPPHTNFAFRDFMYFLIEIFDIPVVAVQQERRPPEPKDKLPANVATSTQKIYIRKDLSSPSAAIPTFSIKVHFFISRQH